VAVRRKSRPGTGADTIMPRNADLERLTNLVALLLVKGEPQVDQIRTLAAAGYRNSEIAPLLGLTSNAVNVALHRIRLKQ
jgi:DNA-directed RNA polymerase specialized sigma24 family protein